MVMYLQMRNRETVSGRRGCISRKIIKRVKKMKQRKNRKGFTLVEVIVVLVILAIMAGVLIPSLTTYIDRAREKNVAADARSAYIAAQALLSEQYGLDAAFEGSSGLVELNDTGASLIKRQDVIELAQLKSYGGTTIKISYADDASIVEFTFTEPMNGYLYTAEWSQDSGAWNVTKGSKAANEQLAITTPRPTP